MTDNEIIKALECCVIKDCGNCPVNHIGFCVDDAMKEALALITRQKGEIERLEDLVYLADSETANVRDLYFEEKSERAEAIKEFAKRLKATFPPRDRFTLDCIDNLVKEMVGADNAE